MTDDNDHTMRAPESEPETTVVPSDASVVEELAWSAETEPSQITGHSWRGYLMSAVLVTLLCAIVIVVTWFSITLYHEHSNRPAVSLPKATVPATKPAPIPTTTATVTAAPPAAPPPVTVTAEPPAPTRTFTYTAEQDQTMLGLITAVGGHMDDPSEVLQAAHETCRLYWHGASVDQVQQEIAAQSGWSRFIVMQVTSTAIRAYPNCFGPLN